MNAANAEALRGLVLGQRIASLGTLHDGEPYVSMVPYAALPDGSGLVIHVSGLAAHTSDMAASPRVSVMIMAAEAPGAIAQSLSRVTIQADAERLAATAAGHDAARAAYVARFPHAERIFELPDFSLFVLRPVSLRLVAGFAQAVTLPAAAFAEALGAR
jgi:heme iron utilization protein